MDQPDEINTTAVKTGAKQLTGKLIGKKGYVWAEKPKNEKEGASYVRELQTAKQKIFVVFVRKRCVMSIVRWNARNVIKI